MDKTINDAIYDVLKMVVEKNNYGMFAKHQPSNRSVSILAVNKITFEKDMILQNDMPLYKIQPRISARAKELLPNLISLNSDWPDVYQRGSHPDR